MGFESVSSANLLAFNHTGKIQDIIAKKQEIFEDVLRFHNMDPKTVLFIGFSGFVFVPTTAKIFVTAVNTAAQTFLTQQGINYTYISEIESLSRIKEFDVVVAVDEFFTYADSDSAQQNLVKQTCNLARHCVITTLRDYKNQDYKDREFSLPSLVKRDDMGMIFLESHSYNHRDRAAWTSNIYAIDQSANNMLTYGGFARRTMYFKQLAKFSFDAGATNFLVHKNLMYKGLCRKNYEHVITIKFNAEK